jgi:PAS domain S-box-containing protein/putative nucleotidyltransferase with HDIG domain
VSGPDPQPIVISDPAADATAGGAAAAVEQALLRQKDLYAVLSQTNKAIIHLVGRDELFAAVCRIAVERGRFRFAWIGLIDENEPRLKPVARYGEDAGYIDQLDVSGNGASASRRGLTGRTLLSGTYVISNDFLNDRAMAPWHKAARRAGVRASAKFPIRQGGVVIGAISLYAGEPGFFSEDLVSTLDEIANDVSFGLDNYVRETARRRAEEALRTAEDQFRSLVEQSIAGIDIIQDGAFAYVNPRFAEILGYGSPAELIGRDPLSIVAEADRSVVAENIRRRVEGEVPSLAYNFTAQRKDGALIDVGAHGARASYRGRPAIIGLMQDISEKKRAEELIQSYIVQLENTFMRTVELATTLSEIRDPYTAGHERRVGAIAAAIGAELGFDAHRVDGLRVTGYLHDIGKISIPTEILSKPGKLSAAELMLIKGHAQASYDILKKVEFPWPVADVALQHHERMDGGGYPQGLKGETILLEARIMAAADVIEAMSSHRPYRPGLGIDKALAEIERGRGIAYDTNVVDACLRVFREKHYQLPA